MTATTPLFPLTRRTTLGGLAGAATLALAPRALAASEPDPLFRHGVASGDPDQTSVVIWTRVSADQALKVKWEVARDAAFTHLVADQTVEQAGWNFTTLPPNVYYMRIQSIDSEGVASVFSQARQLDTQSMLRTGDGNAVQSSDGTSVVRP